MTGASGSGGGGGAGSLGHSSLDNYVSSVRHLSNNGSFVELAEFVAKNLEMLGRIIGSNTRQMNAVLDAIDVREQSLGQLGVLSAVLHQNVDNWDEVFKRIATFLKECNGDQIDFAPAGFAELCHVFADKLIAKKTPILGITLLLSGVRKLRRDEAMLTSVHSDVCKLALMAKVFPEPVLAMLRCDYTDIAREATADSKYILLYFYYGGMILTAIKDFSSALYFYEVCITIPATCVSHIVLEAYKKYLLVFLISQGHKPKEAIQLPKYTSGVVNKYIRPLSLPYSDLVAAFYSNKPDKLQAAIDKNPEIFEADENSGLVAQVQRSQVENNIKRLTRTFLTLSLSELSKRVGLDSPKEAEKIIVAMIEDGKIYAKISQKDGMIRFDSNPEHFNSALVLKAIEGHINSCIGLDSKIGTLDEEIVLNPTFIKKCAMSGPSTTGAGGAGSAAASGSGGHPVSSGGSGGGGMANGGGAVMGFDADVGSSAGPSQGSSNGGLPMNVD